MRKKIIITITIFVMIIILQMVFSQKTEAAITFDDSITFSRKHEDGDNVMNVMPYELYTPSGIANEEAIPLIIWLHGSGAMGKGYKDLIKAGLPALLSNGRLKGFKAYILCPHLTQEWNYESWTNASAKNSLENLLKDFISKYKVDTSNIIITGHSLGGAGALYMAHQLPEYFSSCVVISGYKPGIDISEIKIPTRGYIGELERGENPGSIEYMEYFKTVFGEENTITVGVGHGRVPERAFLKDTDGNGRSDLIEWMSTKKNNIKEVEVFSKDITYIKENCPEPDNADIDYGDMKFNLYTPSTAKDDQSLPLIIWLHGVAGEDYWASTRTGGWNGCFNNWSSLNLEGFNAYILSPYYEYYTGTPWINTTDANRFKQLLDGIIKDKNIDRDNIFIAGHSSGARGLTFIVSQMPEYFSKAVIMSGFGFDGCTAEEYKSYGIETRAYVGNPSIPGDEINPAEMQGCYNTAKNTYEPLFGSENVFYLDTIHGRVPKMTLTKDDDGNGRSDVIEWLLADVSIFEGSDGYYPNGIGLNVESPTTGLDTIAGVIIEPTVEFFTFLIDALMSVFTSIMGQDEFKDVMVDTVDEIQALGEAGATITINDMTPYQTATGKLKLQYPNFKYSSEDIFAGKIDLLDVNFIAESNNDESWLNIRKVVSKWYQILRMISIVGLLSVLIYTGIKIILSSNAKDKAKYKEMIINWFIAVILAFSMHYIMAFILSVIEQIMGLLGNITGVIEVNAGGTVFKTNLIGFARFQMQQQLFTTKIGHLIIYIALVVYTFKFTFVYFKRVLRMAFLTIISPIVALTYPIDKMEGQAKGFNLWLKDFTFNALLQPVHYILYYILVSTSLTLAARNPLYGIIALAFMSQAERLLKTIFGFEKADAGAVGGIAGAFATGAITSSLINHVRDPLHPFGGGKSSSSKQKLGQNDYDYSDDDMPNDLIDDVNFDDFLTTGVGARRELDVERFISDYRTGLSGYSIEDLGGMSFADRDSRSIEEMLQQLSQYQMQLNDPNLSDGQRLEIETRIAELISLLQNRAIASENGFTTIGAPLQYIDNDGRDINTLANDMIRYTQLANDMSLPEDVRQNYAVEAENSMNRLNRRIAENNYIQLQGGPQSLGQQQVESEEEREEPKFVKGMKHVAKTIAKPVWDTEKKFSYNSKKLAKNILKGTAGAAVGITAAAVQAGISITDGKYNALEGVAAVGAGITAVSSIANKGNGELVRAYKEGANDGEDRKLMKEYSEKWYNRDDIIDYYNKEFPGKGKEMRERAANNYLTRGISDLKEQKQAMKFANKLMKEKGLDQQEADKIAIATLQYKKNLSGSNNYTILFNKEKKEAYLNIQTDAYSGAASKASVRQLHEDFIQNVLDFDKVNR